MDTNYTCHSSSTDMAKSIKRPLRIERQHSGGFRGQREKCQKQIILERRSVKDPETCPLHGSKCTNKDLFCLACTLSDAVLNNIYEPTHQKNVEGVDTNNNLDTDRCLNGSRRSWRVNMWSLLCSLTLSLSYICLYMYLQLFFTFSCFVCSALSSQG